jgi:hypothetical protein
MKTEVRDQKSESRLMIAITLTRLSIEEKKGSTESEEG